MGVEVGVVVAGAEEVAGVEVGAELGVG